MEELRERGGGRRKGKKSVRETKWSVFQAANVLSVKSITGGTAGSSSTLQPLFYGVDTATAAVFSSVRVPDTTLGSRT